MVLKIQVTEGIPLNPFLRIFEKKYNLKKYPLDKYVKMSTFLYYSPYAYLNTKKRLVKAKNYYGVDIEGELYVHPDTFKKYLRKHVIKILEKEVHTTEELLKKL